MPVQDYNSNPALNIAISGINIAEGCNASNLNDATRQLMADIAVMLQQGSSARVPGEYMHFAGSAAPAGWLACDGSSYNRTTYAALFAAIGTTYGAGDGSTTFNLPDLRGRMLLGVGLGAGLTNRTLAATGGEETHVLSTAEVPAQTISGTAAGNSTAAGAHNHAVTDPGHSHNFTDYPASTVHPNSSGLYQAGDPHLMGANTQSDSTNSATTGISLAADADHTHAISVAVTGATNGGGGAHNNMPPFVAGNIYIKT